MSGDRIDLDRPGIFRAKPAAWGYKEFETSAAVKVWVAFRIVECLEPPDNVWTDWTQYGDVRVFGDYFVTKKDGTPNTTTVDQLVQCLGWNGSFGYLIENPPPNVVVQIKVTGREIEDKNGRRTVFEAGWINPRDFVPQRRATPEEKSRAGNLDARLGSVMRAAASTAAKAGQAASHSKPAAPPPPAAVDNHPDSHAVAPSMGTAGTDYIAPDDTPF